MSVTNKLFTEQFRPKELSSLIIPDRIRNEVSKGLIQNLLLFGNQGSGKTSLAFILSKNHTTLYINASSERGIDTIREKISNFCATMSLEGNKEALKCVILDEYDGGTPEFYSAQRPVIERFANTTRFIATCNYIQKIPEPIQSRFNCISFDPVNTEEEIYLINEYKKRVALILNAAKITHTPELLDKFVRNDFPDLRTILNKIQSFYLRGTKELNDKDFNINFDFEDLFKLCISKPDKPYDNYKFLAGQYASKIDDVLNALSYDFIEWINSNVPGKKDKIPLIIIAVAEHQAQRTMVIDPFITMLSCVYKLQIILNS